MITLDPFSGGCEWMLKPAHYWRGTELVVRHTFSGLQSLTIPGEDVQRSCHQQRLLGSPGQLIQLPGLQADKKDESWRAKK